MTNSLFGPLDDVAAVAPWQFDMYVDAEIDGARCLGWDWVDKQGDATAVHLLKPWVVTRVAKIDVIDACRGRDTVKLQRIEGVRHLFEQTVCRRQRW